MVLLRKTVIGCFLLLLFIVALLSGCGAPPLAEKAATVPTNMLSRAPVQTSTSGANEALQATTQPATTQPVTAVPTAVPSPTTQQAPTAAESPQSVLEDEVVIVYKRSGGRAGVVEEYSIYRSGRITTNDGREWWAEPEEVERLLQEIEDLGFYDMAPKYIPKNTCCDRFSYELSVQSGDQANTVATNDAAPGAPDELWQALRLVQQFLEQTAPQ